MNKKTIDTICWYIPFKKLRDAVRDYLYTIDEIKRKKEIIITQNVRIETRLKLDSMTKQVIKEIRSPRLIVSLTTYPERHNDVDVVIYSLLTQSILPDKLILWLSNEEYPNDLDSIPENILKLERLGVEIDFCKNIKSYKKLIPTLIKHPDDIIVTADDDIYYPPKWLEQLYNAYLKNPKYLHCHMSRKISFNDKNKINNYAMWKHQTYSVLIEPSYQNFMLGCGGTIYTKKLLYVDISDEDKFMKLCPTADDMWFWAMAILNDTKINLIDNNGMINIDALIDLGTDKNWKKLWETNVSENYNDKQLEALLDYYPELKDKIIGFKSSEYWDNRYINCGNSGAGSYNNLSVFKSEIINTFIDENNIHSMIEWGCGDGNQLKQFIIDNYIGVDVSKTIIDKMNVEYNKDNNKLFFQVSDYKCSNKSNIKADLSISLDVIYHLIEESVFNEYMFNLFNSSNKYVIIYSSNRNQYITTHVKHRKFTDWVEEHKGEWKLIKYISNIYPYDKFKPNDTSFADFYIFKL